LLLHDPVAGRLVIAAAVSQVVADTHPFARNQDPYSESPATRGAGAADLLRLIRGLALRRAGEHRHAELLHQSKVVAVVPDLGDLAVITEAEDVDARELGTPTGCRDATPTPAVGAGSNPASCYQIVLPDEEIDSPLKIGERASKRFRDHCLSSRTRSCLRRAQIVAYIVKREHLFSEVDVPPCPDFVVETHHEPLVSRSVHSRRWILRCVAPFLSQMWSADPAKWPHTAFYASPA
jgi:hypothetical protein